LLSQFEPRFEDALDEMRREELVTEIPTSEGTICMLSAQYIEMMDALHAQKVGVIDVLTKEHLKKQLAVHMCLSRPQSLVSAVDAFAACYHRLGMFPVRPFCV